MLQETGVQGRVWSFHDITERKRIEEALTASETELRTLFASMQDVVMVIDREGVYRKIAPTNPRLLVRPPEELLGKNLKDIFPAEKAEASRQIIQQVLDTKQSTQIEYELMINGRTMWFQATISPLSADSTLWVAHDISNRKQMEEALRSAEANYRSIFESATVGIFQSTPDGHFLSVNPAIAHMFGYASPEEMLASINDIGTQIYRDPTRRQEFQRAMTEQGVIKDFINEEHRKDGGWIWTSTTGRAVEDEAGHILYYEGFQTDITDRKQAEEALMQERNLLRSLIDHVPDYIYVKDTQGRFLTANPALAQLMAAATPDELLGKTDFDFYPRKLAAKYYADEQAIFQSGQPVLELEEPTVDTAGNERWISTTKVPLRNSQGKIFGLVGMGRDITEHKRATEELAKEQNLLLTLINNLPDVIYAKDTQGRKIISNTADWQASGGKRMEDVLGKTDFDTYPAELAARFWSDDKMVLDSGEPIVNREEPGRDSQGNPYLDIDYQSATAG